MSDRAFRAGCAEAFDGRSGGAFDRLLNIRIRTAMTGSKHEHVASSHCSKFCPEFAD